MVTKGKTLVTKWNTLGRAKNIFTKNIFVKNIFNKNIQIIFEKKIVKNIFAKNLLSKIFPKKNNLPKIFLKKLF